ncbi:MAG: hypothetical protein R3D68_13220 [Hyphomicrobiaceae bacterium]
MNISTDMAVGFQGTLKTLPPIMCEIRQQMVSRRRLLAHPLALWALQSVRADLAVS